MHYQMPLISQALRADMCIEKCQHRMIHEAQRADMCIAPTHQFVWMKTVVKTSAQVYRRWLLFPDYGKSCSKLFRYIFGGNAL